MIVLLLKTCLIVLLASLAAVHHVFTNGSRAYPTPLNLFLLYQGLGFVGTVLHADLAAFPSDRTRAFTMAVGLAGAVAGGLAANVLSRFSSRRELDSFRRARVANDAHGAKTALVLLPIAIVSVAVGFIYVAAMGYNLPLELFRAYAAAGDVSGSAAIYGDLRTSVWRDPSRYIAPGYAAQFMKILLPAVFFIWYFRARINRNRFDRLLAVTLALVTLYLLAATGIRSYAILFGAMFITLASRRFGPFGADPRIRTKLVYVVAGGAAVLFGFLSFLGGRSSRGDSVAGNLLGVAWELVERIVFITSDVQLAAMRILQDQPKGWGRAWIESLAILLPGSSPSGSTELYELVYGGFGNAPVDLWTSLWLEFGWIGIIVVPVLLSYWLQSLHIRFVRGPKLLTRTVLFTMMSFTLIILSEPIALFNNGFFTLLLMQGMFLVAAWFGSGRPGCARGSRPASRRPPALEDAAP